MVFSIPSFTTVGDEYNKKKVIDVRSHGKSFAVPGPKSGHLPDALFSKEFQSIHEGDKYVDPGTAEKREKIAKTKKALAGPWRMVGIPKKGCGLGSYFGCIDNKPIPHETDFIVPRKGEKPPPAKHEPRNIVTAPTKKSGTFSDYGMEYIADNYDAKREIERKERELNRKKEHGPFRAACRLGGTFDEAMGTGVSLCYKMTKPMPPTKPKKQLAPLKGPDAPWKPSGPTERLVPKVEYREDPYDHYDPRVGTKRKVNTESKAGWKPGGATNSSWYTRSIAFARL